MASVPHVAVFANALRALEAEQGALDPKPRRPILDELVATVLSQHTSDRNSERAFGTLRRRFPRWEDALEAGDEEIADAIRSGGMADQKAARLRRILTTVRDREGRCDLSRLETLADAEVRGYLASLAGVGPKTVACVLIFSMDRPAFPVDTHVLRLAGRLGWIPPHTTAVRAQELLEAAVPAPIQRALHLALVAHGRTVCRARTPHCGACVLSRTCARRGV